MSSPSTYDPLVMAAFLAASRTIGDQDQALFLALAVAKSLKATFTTTKKRKAGKR